MLKSVFFSHPNGVLFYSLGQRPRIMCLPPETPRTLKGCNPFCELAAPEALSRGRRWPEPWLLLRYRIDLSCFLSRTPTDRKPFDLFSRSFIRRTFSLPVIILGVRNTTSS